MARSDLSRGVFGCLSLALRFELPIYSNPLWQPHPLQGRFGWMLCSRAVAETPFGRREAKLVVAIDDEGHALSPRRLESLLGKPFTTFEEAAEEPLIELEEAADALCRDFLGMFEEEHIVLIEQREEEVERQAARMEKEAFRAQWEGERLLARWRRELRAGGHDEASVIKLRADIARMEDALTEGQRSVREGVSALRKDAALFEASVLRALPLEAEVEPLWAARWTTEPYADDWDRSGSHDSAAAQAFADELRDGGHWFGTERRRKRALRATKAPLSLVSPDRRAAALREFAQATKERTELRVLGGMPRWAPPPSASPARYASAESLPSVTLVIHETGGQRVRSRALPSDDGALESGEGREPNVSIVRKQRLQAARAEVLRALWACKGLSFAKEEQDEALQAARQRLKTVESQREPRPRALRKGIAAGTRHDAAPDTESSPSRLRLIPHDAHARHWEAAEAKRKQQEGDLGALTPDAHVKDWRANRRAREKELMRLRIHDHDAFKATPEFQARLARKQALSLRMKEEYKLNLERRARIAQELAEALAPLSPVPAVVEPADGRFAGAAPALPFAPLASSTETAQTLEPPLFHSGLPAMGAHAIVFEPAAPFPAGPDGGFGVSAAESPPAVSSASRFPERLPEPLFPTAPAAPFDLSAARGGMAAEETFWTVFEHDLLAAMDAPGAGGSAEGCGKNAPPVAFAVERPRASSRVHWFEEEGDTANPVLHSVLANLQPRAMLVGRAQTTVPLLPAVGGSPTGRAADPGPSQEPPAPVAPAEHVPEKCWNAGELAAARARARLAAEQRTGELAVERARARLEAEQRSCGS